MTSFPKGYMSTGGFDKKGEKDNSENPFNQGSTRRGIPDAGSAALSNDLDFPHKDYHDHHDSSGNYDDDDDDENLSQDLEDALPANPS
ncbi:hypothetical protein BO82DRAFT_428615 [Aspergillus uvarum CBS 121591]|uniref:Uncharacterized protein n=1 Tax=Aspergillus uvarum CBS 121591 TaxID=1448315 RepID=A0A319CNX0_9EURO|nr:hypothetical protein BO82DRAFT_428615 [Aspergillus uvarum CBS 121591]PYH86129.1 hypothetical protein BO82DRAFT_428615 [Aspergillus uvarum CBS 121591]